MADRATGGGGGSGRGISRKLKLPRTIRTEPFNPSAMCLALGGRNEVLR